MTTEVTQDDRELAFGAIASGAVNAIKLILQLLMFPVMARLLGPEEFGIYALALPTVTLIALLSDGGLGATLAREDESSELVWSSAFWALLLIGIMLGLFSMGLGIVLAFVAHQPRLSGIIGLLSIGLVFMTISVVPNARLARRKHLGTGAAVDLMANVSGAIIAVIMAWEGAGALSLAVQYLTVFAIRAVLLNVVAFRPPKLTFSLKALRHHFLSGGIMIAIRISEYAGRLAENFLISRLFGTTLLGSYTLSIQVSKFSIEALSNVTWSALYVQALTGEKLQIDILHRRLCRMLGVALFPVSFLVAAAAPELVNLLLGTQWTSMVVFLQVFMLIYSFNAICSQAGSVLQAYGRLDIFFWCTLGLSLGRVLAIGLGYWLGLEAAICGIVVVTLSFSVAMLVFSPAATGCQSLPMLRGLVGPVVSGALAAACYRITVYLFGTSLSAMCMGLAVGLVGYGLAMVVIDLRRVGEDLTVARSIMFRHARRALDPAAL
jgi:PST family polysaccharide transporter